MMYSNVQTHKPKICQRRTKAEIRKQKPQAMVLIESRGCLNTSRGLITKSYTKRAYSIEPKKLTSASVKGTSNIIIANI